MTAEEALADLTDLSGDIEAAVIVGADGEPLAATLDDGTRAREVGRAALALLGTADDVRRRSDLPVVQLHVALRAGSVFIVRDGERAIVATAGPDATAGLVLYDLGVCLRSLAEDGARSQMTNRHAGRT